MMFDFELQVLVECTRKQDCAGQRNIIASEEDYKSKNARGITNRTISTKETLRRPYKGSMRGSYSNHKRACLA